jgi:hypothetical protein
MTAADVVDGFLVGVALWVWPGTLLRAVWSTYGHLPTPVRSHDSD